MATFKYTAPVNYDGDGQLKLLTSEAGSASLSNKNGEYFFTKDEGYAGGKCVIYAPETDNYAAAVLEVEL